MVWAFFCPKTGTAIDPGIEDAANDLAGSDGVAFVALYVRCPHCSEHHELKIERDVLTEAA